jgi:hypothetical protein
MAKNERRSTDGNHLPPFGMLSFGAQASQAFRLGRFPFPA